jgi:hypothetical protein
MAILGKLGSGFGGERRIAAFASAAARLMKTFAMQVEVLRRLRSVGQQFVRVEHIHISDGGQAVVGNVKSRIRKHSRWEAEAKCGRRVAKDGTKFCAWS